MPRTTATATPIVPVGTAVAVAADAAPAAAPAAAATPAATGVQNDAREGDGADSI